MANAITPIILAFEDLEHPHTQTQQLQQQQEPSQELIDRLKVIDLEAVEDDVKDHSDVSGDEERMRRPLQG